MSSTPTMSRPTDLPGLDDAADTPDPALPPVRESAPVNRYGLSPAQIAGSTLAAVTAAVAASTLGVAGTLIGAAIGSLIASVGSAIYAHSLSTAHARLGAYAPVRGGGSLRGSATPTAARAVSTWAQRSSAVPAGRTPTPGTPSSGTPTRRWRGAVGIGVGVVVGAILALGVITGWELIMGHPLGSSTESGTTLTHVASGGAPRARPQPTPSTVARTPTPSPSASASPTASPTPTPSATPTPGPTPSSTSTTQPAPAG